MSNDHLHGVPPTTDRREVGGISDSDRAKRALTRRVPRSAGTSACIELYLSTLKETLHTTLKPMAITISGQNSADAIEPGKMNMLLCNYLWKTKVKHCILISEFSTHHHYHGIIWRTETCVPTADILTYQCKVTTKELTHLKTWITYMFKHQPKTLQYVTERNDQKYLASKIFSNMKKTKLKILTKGINKNALSKKI